MEIRAGTPAQFASFLEAEQIEWARAVKDSGATAIESRSRRIITHVRNLPGTTGEPYPLREMTRTTVSL